MTLSRLLAFSETLKWFAISKEIFKDFDLLAALILDCTAINLKASETHREDFLHKFESVSRGLCYALHCRRFSLLNNMNN